MNYKDEIYEAYGKLADVTKLLLYKSNPVIFEQIEFENDLAFTEPLLFAYFNSNLKDKLTLHQFLWSYFKDENKSETFELTTDKSGMVYIPEYGCLITDKIEDKLICSFEKDLKLHKSEEEVIYSFEPVQKIGGTSISVFTHPSPLLDPFFRGSTGKQIQVELLKDESHIKHFEKALRLIKDVNKNYYDALIATIRGVYFYKGEPNSFATLSAHGIAFFNVEPENEIVFL